MQPESIEWFIQSIRRLPADVPMSGRQSGYNNYRTQKDHWLGWLNPSSGTGTYPRSAAPGRGAKYVYNHIVEPQMLLWLISAAGINPDLVDAAKQVADDAPSLASKSAAIRKQVPWQEVACALLRLDVNNGQPDDLVSSIRSHQAPRGFDENALFRERVAQL
jgi:hypothetical protein